ncbi:MAG: M23 family metallopeptidase [Campylobacterota bacterium]|nr:M23 family metallopeptidase [Campylobacterota bacterium]
MRRKKSNAAAVIAKLLMIIALGLGVYVGVSDSFEREKPVVTIHNSEYWNLKEPLSIQINDHSGIKAYTVILKTTKENFELAHEMLIEPNKELKLNIKPPKRLFGIKQSDVTLYVQAQDASQWNFLKGNSTTLTKKMFIDKKRPQVSVLANSRSITQGGSALVIFKAEDDNLKDLYLESSTGKKFYPQTYIQEGYYASLVAWPVQAKSFRMHVIAKDLAGNISKKYVPFYLKNKQYRISKIKLSDRFLNGKIAELAEEYVETQGVEDKIERFKIINEDVRAKNELLIHDITSKVPDDIIDNLRITPFYPLKNGKKVASFGDHRLYYYDKKRVSESYHLGLDLASVQMGEIKTKNDGKVVFSGDNGIYGNMPIMHLGMGLYTLYGHCSSSDVAAEDEVSAGMKVANTGMSGYAMGDHLHFGVLVQGVEVRPEEWMDKQWLKLNIADVFKSAEKIINRG